MKTIHLLPPSLVSKIAAGEVVERPVYALKELIENSFDAKASSIDIQIEKGGLKKIQVIDNGVGMSKEDLLESFKPHTTSKLSPKDEIVAIKTLGFRGEALSSIASVSTLIIKSRIEKETGGTVVTIKEGKLIDTSPIGMPPGTTILVENLFSSVPARKKFLKSEKTEFRLMVELLTHFALSYPKVHFSLIHNRKTIFDLPKNQSLIERVKTLLGKDISQNLLPINFEDGYVKISGFLTKPQVFSLTGQNQFLFINNRKVTDKMISLAVKESYGGLLSSKASPVFALFVSLPFEAVDVNIHPRKESVNFLNSKELFDTIGKGVSETLVKFNLTFSNLNWKGNILYSDPPLKTGLTNSLAGELLKEELLPWEISLKENILRSSEVVQLHNLYLTAATKNGLLIIDQHAAHERVLFEKFSQEFKKQKSLSEIFTLSSPLPFDLSFTDSEILNEYLREFKRIGFEIEQFKDTTYKLYTLPALLKDRNPLEIIKELLEEFTLEKDLLDIDSRTQKMLAFLSCRSAVKQGEPLTKQEARKLFSELERTPQNYTCPHGRPTKIEISLERLDKAFKR